MNRPLHSLPVESLTADAFRPFGDVVEASDAVRRFTINDGYAERFHELASVDTGPPGGRAVISIFKARPRMLPMQLILLERHPLGSQAFMPLSARAYLVVVAHPVPHGATPATSSLRCFLAQGNQGINYARGTWHHPLIALDAPCDFLVVDRGGSSAERNCDEYPLGVDAPWVDFPP